GLGRARRSGRCRYRANGENRSEPAGRARERGPNPVRADQRRGRAPRVVGRGTDGRAEGRRMTTAGRVRCDCGRTIVQPPTGRRRETCSERCKKARQRRSMMVWPPGFVEAEERVVALVADGQVWEWEALEQ